MAVTIASSAGSTATPEPTISLANTASGTAASGSSRPPTGAMTTEFTAGPRCPRRGCRLPAQRPPGPSVRLPERRALQQLSARLDQPWPHLLPRCGGGGCTLRCHRCSMSRRARRSCLLLLSRLLLHAFRVGKTVRETRLAVDTTTLASHSKDTGHYLTVRLAAFL